MRQKISPIIRARRDIFDAYWKLYLRYNIVKTERWCIHSDLIRDLLNYINMQAFTHFDWGIELQQERDKAEKKDDPMVHYYDAYLAVYDQMKDAILNLMVQFVESFDILSLYGFYLIKEEQYVNQLKHLLIPPSTTKCDHCRRKAAVKCPVCKQYLCSRHFGAFWAIMKHGACTYCKRTSRIPSKLQAWMKPAALIVPRADETSPYEIIAYDGAGMRIVSVTAFGHRDLSQAMSATEQYMRLIYQRISPPLLASLEQSLIELEARLLELINEQFI